MCSQGFSTNELEVDFLTDLVIFKYFFFVDPELCRPGVKVIGHKLFFTKKLTIICENLL